MDYDYRSQIVKSKSVRNAADKVQFHAPLFKKIHVIINPHAAGVANGKPILGILDKTFGATDTEWDASIMRKHSDGRRLARKAVKAGCDLVAAHGGDGTLMQIASGLYNTGVPLAIFPGGTANSMAGELNIPKDVQMAVNLVASGEYELQTVDMGIANDQPFILRVAVGLEAAMQKNVDKNLRKEVGALAYAFSGINQLRKLDPIQYKVKVDGESFEVEGVYCMIANSANLGLGKLQLSDKVNVSDGLLDLIILDNADLGTLVSVGTSILTGNGSKDNPMLHHWQGRKIKVKTRKQQPVSMDGKVLGELPIKAHVLPGALKIVVPKQTPSEIG